MSAAPKKYLTLFGKPEAVRIDTDSIMKLLKIDQGRFSSSFYNNFAPAV